MGRRDLEGNIKELKLAPTAAEFLRELVSKPGEFVIPSYEYLQQVHDWADTVWFDTERTLRNGSNSFDFRINAAGMQALLNDTTYVSYRLGLGLAKVREIAEFYHLKNTEH